MIVSVKENANVTYHVLKKKQQTDDDVFFNLLTRLVDQLGLINYLIWFFTAYLLLYNFLFLN